MSYDRTNEKKCGVSKMDIKVLSNMEMVERMAAADPQYRQMLFEMRAIERKYNDVLSGLSSEEQNAICDFVSQCEEMSWRMLELSCTIKESPSV